MCEIIDLYMNSRYMPPNPGSKIGNSQENEDLSDCRDCLEERWWKVMIIIWVHSTKYLNI